MQPAPQHFIQDNFPQHPPQPPLQHPTLGAFGPSNFGPLRSTLGALRFISGAFGIFGLQHVPQHASPPQPMQPAQQPTFGTFGPSNFGALISGAFNFGTAILGAFRFISGAVTLGLQQVPQQAILPHPPQHPTFGTLGPSNFGALISGFLITGAFISGALSLGALISGALIFGASIFGFSTFGGLIGTDILS